MTCCHEADSLDVVLNQLSKENILSMPVLDESNKYVGVISVGGKWIRARFEPQFRMPPSHFKSNELKFSLLWPHLSCLPRVAFLRPSHAASFG